MNEVVQGQEIAAPSSAAEASARLDVLISDKEWAGKLLAGDGLATKEFHDLSALIAADEKVEAAMSGKGSVLPGGIPDSQLKLMTETAGYLREHGVGEGAVRQTLTGEKVSKKEYELVTAWKAQHMRDGDFTKKYLAGDSEATRQMTLANIVLASEIKDGP
jgi:hypothetical protein